jgi:U3 small nucleolar RNA-associated protein 12
LFLPKNRFFLIGDKEGSLHLYDLSKAEKIQEIKAHDGSVWSLSVHEKPSGYEGIVIISGSADKQIKMWEIVLDTKTKQISLSELKHFWMTDDIHCVKFSPNGDYYATSLLDSSIKVRREKTLLRLFFHLDIRLL